MAATISYDRPKTAVVNSTGMALTILVAESVGAVAAIGTGGTGSTGKLLSRWDCDADESGGVDVQALVKIEVTPLISAAGVISFKVEFIPVLGDATDGATLTKTFTHPETMDAWQTAAGRARQA